MMVRKKQEIKVLRKENKELKEKLENYEDDKLMKDIMTSMDKTKTLEDRMSAGRRDADMQIKIDKARSE